MCAEEVLTIRGVPSHPVPCAGGDHIPIEGHWAKRAELGEEEHVPVQDRGECDTRTTATVPDPTDIEEIVRDQSTHHNRAELQKKGVQDARGL